MVGGLGTAPDSRIGTGTPLPRGPCLSVTAGRVTQRRAGPLGPWNCHKWKFSNPNALSWRPKVSHRGMGQFLPPRPSTHWRCTPALNPQPRLWGSEREHPVPEQLQEMHRLAAGIAAMAMGHNSNNNSDLSMDSVYYHSPNLADQLMETLDGIPDQGGHRDDCISTTAAMMESERLQLVGGPGSLMSSANGRAVFEVLRVTPEGKTRRIYAKRRDLLRAHNIPPRDLRRIDPSLSVGKSIYSISIRESCLLIALGGVRLIVTGDRTLLFEPTCQAAQQFLDISVSHLQQQAGARLIDSMNPLDRPMMSRNSNSMGSSELSYDESKQPETVPFELEMVEAALIVATGNLDKELAEVEGKVQRILEKLPRNINPVNLEKLRSVKAALVDIEGKADTLREVLEDLMDDEDEMREMNISTRPQRGERRRQRERERLERERQFELEREARRERALAEEGKPFAETEAADGNSSGEWPDVEGSREEKLEKWWEEEKLREAMGFVDDVAQSIAAAEEAKEAERELEQVEDMLDYYLQRATMTLVEARQLLTGARDLEESIGISLSARRFEVNRLELTLSIGSFAAALGAMIAGIFGMNLRSTLEMSIIGFWGTTAGIILGCAGIFAALYRSAKQRQIL